MRCPYCGAENLLGVEACLSCLHPLPIQYADKAAGNVRYVPAGQDVGPLPLHVAKRALAMRAAGIKKVHHLTTSTSSTSPRPAPDLRPPQAKRSEPYLGGAANAGTDPATN